MTCPACIAFDEAERAAIERRDMPPHSLDGCTCEADPTIAMTLLGPERLPLSPQRGVALEVTWPELVRWVSYPVVTLDKASVGGFALAKLRDGIRRKSHVEYSQAIGLDHDAGTMTPQAAHERLARYRHVVFTTWSHQASAPRWRAILVASRPMTVDEHAIVWSRIAKVVERDAALDAAPKDPCRLWYCPTVRPGGEFRVFVGEGAAIDVDRLLARVAVRPANGPTRRASTGDSYLAAALERECAAVASAKLGARNVTLNRACYSLARLDISTSDIANALLAAAKRAGLPDRESRKTIASALGARRGRA